MAKINLSIPKELKIWLNTYSEQIHCSTSEIILEAILDYKENVEKDWESVLLETAGLWKNKERKGYVEKLRDEWKNRD